MKHIGFLSLTIGALGFAVIMYYEYQFQQILKEMGELEGLIQIYPYGQTEFYLLNISQVLGIILGITGIRKGITKKISIAGTVLCLINFLLIYIL